MATTPSNLDPQLLQQLLELRKRQADTSNNHSQTWFGPGNDNSNNGWRLYHQKGMRQTAGGDQEEWTADPSLI